MSDSPIAGRFTVQSSVESGKLGSLYRVIDEQTGRAGLLLVLAAETAVGDHPVECVKMVRTLIDQFEARRWPRQKHCEKSQLLERTAQDPSPCT